MITSEDPMVINKSWWNRRTILERRLIIVTGIISIIALIFFAVFIQSSRSKQVNQLEEEEAEENTCLTTGCIHTASNVLKYIDSSVNPCDDFYQFACGGFLRDADIPENKASVVSSDLIEEAIKLKLKAIVEEPAKLKELKPFKLLKKLYNVCMNTAAIEADGFETLTESILKPLGDWPVLKGKYWNMNAFDWKNFTYTSRKLGVTLNTFISIYISPGWKNSTKYTINVAEGELGMNREILIKGYNDEVVQGYYAYMVDIAVTLGAEKGFAEREMKKSLEFEIELAKIHLENEVYHNLSRLYNPITINDLQRKHPGVPWLEYINKVINLRDVSFTGDEVVEVTSLKFIENLIALLEKTPKRIQANYAIFNIVKWAIPFLTEEIRNEKQEYLKIIYGISEKQSRWRECLDIVTKKLNFATGALYVRKYFNEETKNKVIEMVTDIHGEFNETLKQLEWMDDDTKTKALEKAETMSFFVGYPEELLNNKKLEEYYAKLRIDSSNFLTFVQKIEIFERDVEFSALLKLVDKADWITLFPSFMVDAAYSPSLNRIDLPAGILQGVFFDSDRPQYMNYGGIGCTIGHEIIHGFDNRGRKFDKDGNLQDWWAKDTEECFLKEVKCIINQYGKLTVPEINAKVDGVNTQGENIADNGGIKLAYSAYQAWVERNNPEPLLPNLNYTQNQLFWISAANTWCGKFRKEMLKDQIVDDQHAPQKFRVQVPFSNSEYFAEDFDCPVGSKMNPKEKCRVW